MDKAMDTARLNALGRAVGFREYKVDQFLEDAPENWAKNDESGARLVVSPTSWSVGFSPLGEWRSGMLSCIDQESKTFEFSNSEVSVQGTLFNSLDVTEDLVAAVVRLSVLLTDVEKAVDTWVLDGGENMPELSNPKAFAESKDKLVTCEVLKSQVLFNEIGDGYFWHLQVAFSGGFIMSACVEYTGEENYLPGTRLTAHAHFSLNFSLSATPTLHERTIPIRGGFHFDQLGEGKAEFSVPFEWSCGFRISHSLELLGFAEYPAADWTVSRQGSLVRLEDEGNCHFAIDVATGDYCVTPPSDSNAELWGGNLAASSCLVFKDEEKAFDYFGEYVDVAHELIEPLTYGQATFLYGTIQDSVFLENQLTGETVLCLGVAVDEDFTELFVPAELVDHLSFSLVGSTIAGLVVCTKSPSSRSRTWAGWRSRHVLDFPALPQGPDSATKWGRACRQWAAHHHKALTTGDQRVSTWSKALLSDDQAALGLAYAVECLGMLQEGDVHPTIIAAHEMLEANAQPWLLQEAGELSHLWAHLVEEDEEYSFNEQLANHFLTNAIEDRCYVDLEFLSTDGGHHALLIEPYELKEINGERVLLFWNVDGEELDTISLSLILRYDRTLSSFWPRELCEEEKRALGF